MGAFAALRTLCAVGAAILLQGCVAAALPMLASGAIVRGESNGVQSQASSNHEPVPPSPAPTASSTHAKPRFALLANYAMQQTNAMPSSETPRSAMLKNPALLDGERRACGTQTPAVLIDLDPGDMPMPLGLQAAQPDHHDSNLLESLRRQGVEIGWVSGRSAADAGDIRSWLESTGLDQSGEDSLLLMRYPNDRKQSRRNEFAQEFCVIAIAGDKRADFDELYDFLIDPAKAIALEPLYGDGWFMIPSLTSQEQE